MFGQRHFDTIRFMQEAGDKTGDSFYNKTVTIWNKYTDGLMETETWLPTLIKNVRLLVSKGNNVMNSGLDAADSARLHIMDGISDLNKPYLDPIAWGKLSAEEKAEYFTLESENDSFFAEGDTSEVDPSGKENFFDFMKKNQYNCFKITSVDRFEIIPHWECWGK